MHGVGPLLGLAKDASGDLDHPWRTFGPIYSVIHNTRMKRSRYLPVRKNANIKPFCDNIIRSGVRSGGVYRGM